MAAGMAKQRALPVFAVYSTFLQRSYDMLLHDVGIQGLHVVFAVDRAGLVGEDGETHHGVFDVAYLSSVPGMRILCPANFAELRVMLRHAVLELTGPAAVRYPRGGEGALTALCGAEGASVVRQGTDITLIAYGTMINEALSAADLLEERGVSAQVLKLNSIAPLDMDAIAVCVERTAGRLLVAEECAAIGSAGERLCAGLAQKGISLRAVRLCSAGEGYLPQGAVTELRRLCGLDHASLERAALEVWKRG